MSNYKIRVNNEAESKEAQRNLEQLGFEKLAWGIFIHNSYFIFADRNYYSRDDISNFSECDYKEITLPELRDLVILNRNDENDATHTNIANGRKYLVLSDGVIKIWWPHNNYWSESYCYIDDLKPIEKPMREWLNTETYEYKKSVDMGGHSKWIEIPEGAESFNYFDDKENLFFLKGNSKDTLFSNDLNGWYWKHWGDIDFDGVVCLWQRHTHPEELPFIDDEPLQSLNDQYAEIEKVRQTLNQRQEQYGSFEDVAMITEQMVDVMRKGYYENLAYNQKMALYMICSKMARIVNGNPNHKDSWHDIAGYATLIDNELVSEKDMPF